MDKQYQYSKSRLITANFSTVLSIALVLFMVVVLVLFSFHAWYFSSQIKEEVAFTLYIAPNSTIEQDTAFVNTLRTNKMVKSATYTSQEQATELMNNVMGKDHLDVLEGFNPYQPSIEVHLKAVNFSVKQIKRFISYCEKQPFVELVDYRDDLINNINSNIYNVSTFFVVILIALLIICVTLINHTINLTISAKKLLIRTMQLVGAKSSFIRRPFLIKGFYLGLFGGLLAVVFAAGLIAWIYTLIGGFDLREFITVYYALALCTIITGILLSLLFTAIAVKRNMNLKDYKLYN